MFVKNLTWHMDIVHAQQIVYLHKDSLPRSDELFQLVYDIKTNPVLQESIRFYSVV